MSTARVNNGWVSGFTADTPVLMAGGEWKPISEVKKGDWVSSFNPSTGEPTAGYVTGTWAEVMNDVIEVSTDEKSMLVASKQLFFTPQGKFAEAPQATALVKIDGTPVKFRAKKVKGKHKMHDITVDSTHAFIADGLRVHNRISFATVMPVVTAGRVGEAVSVSVNGGIVTVTPPPDSPARVSVGYFPVFSGGFTVINNNPILIPPPFPRPKFNIEALNYVKAAQSARDTVCSDMLKNPGGVSKAERTRWVSGITDVINKVNSANRADWPWYGTESIKIRFAPWPENPRGSIYNDIINDAEDLKKFILSQSNLSSKNIAFIRGKCSEIESSLGDLQRRLNQPFPIPVEWERPPYWGTRIWQYDPRFYYYAKEGVYNGFEYWVYREPNKVFDGGVALGIPGKTQWYKRLDQATGYYYFDNTPFGQD